MIIDCNLVCLTRLQREGAILRLQSFYDMRRAIADARRDVLPPLTQRISPTAGVSGGDPERRPMEDLAIKLATTPSLAWMERQTRAIDWVMTRKSRQTQFLVYWVYMAPPEHRTTLEEAATRCKLPVDEAEARLERVLVEIAAECGVISGEVIA